MKKRTNESNSICRRFISLIISMFMAVTLMVSSIMPVSAASAAEKPMTNATFPTEVTINVGESVTLEVSTEPADTTYLTNIAWGTQGNGCFTSQVNGCGSYWGRPSSETITGTKAGKGYLSNTVDVFDSNKQKVTQYKFRTVVTVTESKSSSSQSDASGNVTDSTDGSKTNQKTTTDSTASENNSTDAGAASSGKPLKSISLSKKSVSLKEGKSTSLTVSYYPSDTTASKKVTWTTSDAKVAKVSGGKITGKGDGIAVITAKCGSAAATCVVYVTGKDGYVSVGDAYKDLNAFRTKKGVWQWNKNNKTKKYFNTNKSNTLSKLKRNTDLEKTAKIRAKEAATKFSHTRPDGTNCFTVYPKKFTYIGENLAAYVSADGVIELWMEEDCKYSKQGHRRNMLDKKFKSVGIAGYRKDGVTYWAMCLGN